MRSYLSHRVRQEEPRKLEGRDGTGRQKCFHRSQGHCVPARVCINQIGSKEIMAGSPASAVSQDVPCGGCKHVDICPFLPVTPRRSETVVKHPPSFLISPLQHASRLQLLLFMLLLKC